MEPATTQFIVEVPKVKDASLRLAMATMEVIERFRNLPAGVCNQDVWTALRFVWDRQNTQAQAPLQSSVTQGPRQIVSQLMAALSIDPDARDAAEQLTGEIKRLV